MLVVCTGRVRAEGLSPADLAGNPVASDYGSGEAGRTLRFPGSPEARSRYDDHRGALRQAAERSGMACTKYVAFDAMRPWPAFGLEAP
jgi:hypothetical protein